MDKKDIIYLLHVLKRFPTAFNYLDEQIAGWLETEGLFDTEVYGITPKALAILVDLDRAA